MIKTVLLTGATGYLGRHLLAMLRAQNIECVALIRKTTKLDCLEGLKDQISFCELDNLAEVFKQKKIDAIIHTATAYGRKNESFAQMLETNLHLPTRILELAQNHGVKLFINTGTMLNPMTNVYSLSKAQFCEWGQFFAEQTKIKFINVKMEHMYGPFDDETKFTTYVIRACLRNDKEVILTKAMQKRDFIYIEDVISVYQCLLTTEFTDHVHFEEFQLGSGVATSVRDFVELVHQLTQAKTELKFGLKPSQPHEQDYVADIAKLKKLGWHPKYDLRAGLSKTIKEEQGHCVI